MFTSVVLLAPLLLLKQPWVPFDVEDGAPAAASVVSPALKTNLKMHG